MDRAFFFDWIRPLFGGSLEQSQVDGMNYILNAWEAEPKYSDDLRWLAYALATTFHETAQTMQPIEEYGRGAGMPYGVPDPQTGQTYYGRGFVQLTWHENYATADKEIGLTGDASLVWNADNALDPAIAAEVMFRGMVEGWFTGKQLDQYFNDDTNDAFNARDMINGDKHIVPDWGTKPIGTIIAGYHDTFWQALEGATGEDDDGLPQPVGRVQIVVTIVLLGSSDIVVESVSADAESLPED